MLQLQPVSVVFLSSSTVVDVPHASNNNNNNNDINTNDDGINDDDDDDNDDDHKKREIIMMTMIRISIIIKHKCLGVWENKVLVEKTDHLRHQHIYFNFKNCFIKYDTIILGDQGGKLHCSYKVYKTN